MEKTQVSVSVLRLSDKFTVHCQNNQNIKAFKDQCKKLSKFPIDNFDIIIDGKVLNESDPNVLKTICDAKKIYLFVKSFYKNDEPDEFIMNKRVINRFKGHDDEGNSKEALFNDGNIFSIMLPPGVRGENLFLLVRK